MTPELTRRLVMQLGAAALLAIAPRTAHAQLIGDIADQPWAKGSAGETPLQGGTLRLAAADYIGEMNPNHWPVNDWVTMSYFLEKLLTTDGEYRTTVPWLAESLEQQDAVTVTMKLRQGVLFQDGSRFDAQAVKDQIAWLQNPADGAWSVSMLDPLASIDVVSSYELRWKFKQSWGAFNGTMSSVPGYVLSPQALKLGSFDSMPKGTGPYVVAEGKEGSYLRLKRNPNWWFAKLTGHSTLPYFDEILVSVIPNPATRLANLQAGKIDMLVLDKSQYKEMKKNQNVQVYRQPLNSTTALRFNSAAGPFKDIRLRKAVSHAIPRDLLIRGTQYDLGREAGGLFPVDHWAHDPGLTPSHYDPALAKRLMAEAGYPNGLTVKGFFGNTAPEQTLAQALQGVLEEVGVRWNVEPLSPTAASSELKNANFDLASGGWTYIFDPDVSLTGLYVPGGAFSQGRQTDPKLTQMIVAARQQADESQRRQMYWSIDRYITEQCLDIWLWWEESAIARSKHLQGWDQDLYLKYKDAYAGTQPMWFANGASG